MDSLRPDGAGPVRVLARSSVLAILALALGAFAFTGCGDDQAAELHGMTRQPPIRVAGTHLPQKNPSYPSDGRMSGRDGRLLLVYFGYTSCPDVCPTTLADLRLALGELDPEQRERVDVGMVTVDPARDTSRVLNGYLRHFFPDGRFASFVPGDVAQLRAAERAFGATHRLGEPNPDGSYDVEHSAQVFAVDGNGEVRVEWPFGEPPENIASDLRLLLKHGGDANEKQGDEE